MVRTPLIASLVALGILRPRDAQAASHNAPRTPRKDTAHVRTRVSMRNVDFFVDSAVVLHIRRLDGTMRSKEGGPILFDDKNSFVFAIDTAEVGLTGADLKTTGCSLAGWRSATHRCAEACNWWVALR